MAMETAFRSDERFTPAQFFEWLRRRPRGDRHRYELLGGHIVMTPPAGFPHSPIAVRISAALLQHVDAQRIGVVNDSSAGFEFPGNHVLEPDVSFISAATLAAGPKTQTGGNYRVVPELVVEILSRATARRDRTEKLKIYEQNGVREYWIVDPQSRHVSVYRLSPGGYGPPLEVIGGAVESSVLQGLIVPLATIFADCE